MTRLQILTWIKFKIRAQPIVNGPGGRLMTPLTKEVIVMPRHEIIGSENARVSKCVRFEG